MRRTHKASNNQHSMFTFEACINHSLMELTARSLRSHNFRVLYKQNLYSKAQFKKCETVVDFILKNATGNI